MRYYPVNLDIRSRPCLVVGGGAVGTRKVLSLLACGAHVTVVSPAVSDALAELCQSGGIRLRQREYRAPDLDAMFLVIGATDDESLNRRIHADAERRNMLCNIADRPAACNFILPAVISRGDLTIAVSTAGKSPAFAKRLRRQLETQFGEEYGRFLQLMGEIRKRLLRESHAPEAHKPVFERLIAGHLLEWIRDDDIPSIDAFLAEVLGPGYEYASLMKTDSREMA